MIRAITHHAYWPTPVVVVETDSSSDYHERLAERILEKERELCGHRTPTPVAGVTDGLTALWLTYNVLNWNYPECVVLRSLILKGVEEFIRYAGEPDPENARIAGISCWANVLRRGQGLDIHHHDPAFLSGHYIVRRHLRQDATDANGAGHTVYFRPGFIERSQGDSGFGSPWDSDWRISVPPTVGRLTLFPSYVRHEVKPHQGENERISIAFDVYLKKQKNVLFHFAPPRWFVPAPAGERQVRDRVEATGGLAR